MAAVLEVSYLSVHKWEAGAAKPRVAQLQKIAAVMKLGKRDIQKKLQSEPDPQ
jgi:DNA-binding transcriptional regulator YiaG